MSPLQFLLLDEKHFLVVLYLSLLKIILHCDLQLLLFSLKDFILKLPGITFKNYRYNLQMPSTC